MITQAMITLAMITRGNDPGKAGKITVGNSSAGKIKATGGAGLGLHADHSCSSGKMHHRGENGTFFATYQDLSCVGMQLLSLNDWTTKEKCKVP